jgi:preprotein translocase subunit SecD
MRAEYPRLGLRVLYAVRPIRDLDAPVDCLILDAPDAKAPEAVRGPVDVDKPRLAFRLVAPAGAAGQDVDPLTDANDTAKQIAVERRVLVDERDVADVSTVPVDKEFKELAVYLKMTPAGAKKLKAATAGNIGRQLAIVLDGRVLMAPVIRSEISEAVSITMGTGAAHEDARVLAGRLHAAVSQSAEAK